MLSGQCLKNGSTIKQIFFGERSLAKSKAGHNLLSETLTRGGQLFEQSAVALKIPELPKAAMAVCQSKCFAAFGSSYKI
ncbi:hypothetical protein QCD79_04435 [Pseudomonas quasicaspiana]|uniref:hypothetical protein n=1 Tax=Pseudomonas quasicaspiana TaxID=2829821 RepID=UPI001E5D6BA7|nr:hypothetical protein [Pseudomonas quasicaspiana]MCD5987094.1 hypothetical protein [Pseudomonas quasicaspiana]MDG6399232.1 hypothetical protein [Pseudomonas quasicaspiana]